jgi:acyl-CoA synthetase (AMP-forming)/AMP-acid ligase II
VVAVVAFNPRHESVTDDDLRAAATDRIARFKLPKAFVRVDAVLRSPAGKADYRWARQTAADVAAPTEEDR